MEKIVEEKLQAVVDAANALAAAAGELQKVSKIHISTVDLAVQDCSLDHILVIEMGEPLPILKKTELMASDDSSLEGDSILADWAFSGTVFRDFVKPGEPLYDVALAHLEAHRG